MSSKVPLTATKSCHARRDIDHNDVERKSMPIENNPHRFISFNSTMCFTYKSRSYHRPIGLHVRNK